VPGAKPPHGREISEVTPHAIPQVNAPRIMIRNFPKPSQLSYNQYFNNRTGAAGLPPNLTNNLGKEFYIFSGDIISLF
jgi:hypothetical protein